MVLLRKLSGLAGLLTGTMSIGVVSCKTSGSSGVESKKDKAVAVDAECQMPAPSGGLDDLAKVFYQDNRLATADITMNDADWETLRNQSPPKPCALSDFKYDKFKVSHLEVDGVDLGTFKIKKKSICGSLSTTKPGVDLDKTDKDGRDVVFPVADGEVGLSRLIFNNSVQDPAYMRQCFSYGLMRDFKYPAPLCNYVKLCVNGKYKGLYINVEALDEQFAARNFGDKQSQGIMVEGDWTGAMSGIHADFYPPGNKILDGKDLQGNPHTYQPWDVWGVKFPKDSDALQKNLSRTEYANFLAVLIKDPAQVTAADVEVLNQFVDIEQYRKYFIFDYLLGNFDGANGNQNNYYVYFDPAVSKWYYLPWGMDQTIQGPPKWNLAALRLANTFLHSPTLKKGLADDYAKLAAQISEPDRKAAVLNMGATLKPFIAKDQQANWDKTLDYMTNRFWCELNTNAFAGGPTRC